MSDALEKRSEKIKKWFKNRDNLYLFSIFALAIAIRLFYFWIMKQQPIWWDEAEYMAKAKKLAFGFQWYDYWSPKKPILLTWMFAALYRIGFDETAFRFIIFLFSIFGVAFSYLVVKELFEKKKIAMISAALMSVFWVHLFFTGRLLVELPAATLFFAGLYFFIKGFLKKGPPWNIWLAGIFFSLGFLMRVSYGVYLLSLGIFAILEDKRKVFLNKNVWIAFVLACLIISPFVIFIINSFPKDPFGQFIGINYGRFRVGKTLGDGAMGFKGIPEYIKDVPNVLGTATTIGMKPSLFSYYFTSPIFLLLLVGLVLFFADLFLGPDLIFKKEYRHLRIKLFILLWLITPYLFFGYTRMYVEQRDTIPVAPFFFAIAGIGAIKIKEALSKYNKYLAVIAVAMLIILGMYIQTVYGYNMILYKINSFKPVKDAGLWLKQNSAPTDIVWTMSTVQNLYYSERETFSYSNMKQEDFEKEIAEQKPAFYIASTFEPALNPQWAYLWGQNHPEIAKPVWFWADDPKNPRQFLVVYKMDWSNFTGFLNNTGNI